jgi:hypothetical protein
MDPTRLRRLSYPVPTMLWIAYSIPAEVRHG